MSKYKGTDLFHVDFDIKTTFEVNTPLTAEIIEKLEDLIWEALSGIESWEDDERYKNISANVKQSAVRYDPRLFVEHEDWVNSL